MHESLSALQLAALAYVLGMLAVATALRLGLRAWRRIGVGSYAVLLALFAVVALAAYSARDFLLAHGLAHELALGVGIATLLAFAVVRVSSVAALGWRSFFSLPLVEPNGKEELVARGPYKYVRHPVWLSYLLLGSGAFLATSALGFLLSFALWLLVTPLLVSVEERELRERMGGKFSSYARRVRWRVLPGVY